MRTKNALPRRSVLRTGLGLSAASLIGRMAWASSDFPNKPLRFVVPFAAGGALDYVARMVGAQFTAATGQQVIVDTVRARRGSSPWTTSSAPRPMATRC